MIKASDFKLSFPSSLILAAPSQARKSSVCRQILSNPNKYYSKPIKKIIIVHQNAKELYKEIEEGGIPCICLSSIGELDEFLEEFSLVCIDDQIIEIETNIVSA